MRRQAASCALAAHGWRTPAGQGPERKPHVSAQLGLEVGEGAGGAELEGVGRASPGVRRTMPLGGTRPKGVHCGRDAPRQNP